jgi:hypothetical protein
VVLSLFIGLMGRLEEPARYLLTKAFAHDTSELSRSHGFSDWEDSLHVRLIGSWSGSM